MEAERKPLTDEQINQRAWIDIALTVLSLSPRAVVNFWGAKKVIENRTSGFDGVGWSIRATLEVNPEARAFQERYLRGEGYLNKDRLKEAISFLQVLAEAPV